MTTSATTALLRRQPIGSYIRFRSFIGNNCGECSPLQLSLSNGVASRRWYAKGASGSTIKLVLMRHGQSRWNQEARFTGWADIGLTSEGEKEAARAGAALRELGFEIDQCYTSMLKRSVRSAWIMMGELGTHWVPVTPTWNLNERHYGALTGMSKPEATAKLGNEAVMRWRRSWSDPPPPIEADHPLFHKLVDRRYANAVGSHVVLPATESLRDVSDRVVGFWDSTIEPALRRGEQCLVVAHAHTLRSLIKYLDEIDEKDIEELTIPTGTPLVYSLDRTTLKPVRRRAMTGMRTSHLAIDDVPEIVSPLDENCAVEKSQVVSTQTIGEEALKQAAAHTNACDEAGTQKSIEAAPYEKIKLCNRTWRVLSGPGIIEDAEVLQEHRKMGEESSYGASMVFLSESVLKGMTNAFNADGKDAAEAAELRRQKVSAERRKNASKRSISYR